MDSSNVPPPGSRPIKEPKRRLNRGLSGQGSSSNMFNTMNQPSFGGTPSTPPGSMPSFGQQPQQQQQQQQQQQPFSFNQSPATSQQPQTPSFQQQQQQQQPGGFGGGQVNRTLPFSFGAPSMSSAQSTPSSPGFTFGNQTPNTGFNTGMQQQQQQQSSTIGGFGSSPASSFSLGGQTAQPTASPFGTQPLTSGFGTQTPTSGIQQSSSTPTAGFSFGNSGTSQGTATTPLPATATTPAFGAQFSGGSAFGEQPKKSSSFTFGNTLSSSSQAPAATASPFGSQHPPDTQQQQQKRLSFGGFGGSPTSSPFTANQSQMESTTMQQRPSSPFSSSTPADTTTSSISFGTHTQKAAPSSPFSGIGSPKSSNISFGSTPKKDITTEEKEGGDKPATFSFGSPIGNKTTSDPDQAKPSFSFGSTAVGTAASDQAKPGFSFGSTAVGTATSDQVKSGFSFGSTSGTFGTGQKRKGADLESSEPSKSRPFQFNLPSGGSGLKSQPSFGSTDRKEDKQDDMTKDNRDDKHGKDDSSAEKKGKTSKDDDKGTATASGFSFGQSTVTSQSTDKPAFSFGTFAQKSTTDKTDDKAKPSSPSATNTTSFSFGKQSSGGFSFGTPQQSSEGTTIEKTPSFSFGTSAPKSTTDSSTEKTPSFSFGTSTEKPTTDSSTEKTPAFSFGAPTQNKSTDSSTEKTAIEDTFGTPTQKSATEAPTEKTPATGFSFGTSTQKPATTTANVSESASTGFSFGTQAQKSSNEGTTSDKPAAVFSFGTPSQASSTDTSVSKTPATFSFGTSSKTPSADTTTTKPAKFSFGASSDTASTDTTTAKTPAAFSFGAPSTTAKVPPTFSFGTPAQTTSTDTSADKSTPKKPAVFSFGSSSQISSTDTSTTKTPATFSFGTTKDSATEKTVPSSTPTFSFGGASTTSKESSEPQTKGSNLFNFGTKPSTDTETADDKTGQKRKGNDMQKDQPTKMPSFQFNPKATLASATGESDQQEGAALKKPTPAIPASTDASDKLSKAVTFQLPELPKSQTTTPSTKEIDKLNISPFSVTKSPVVTSVISIAATAPVVTKPEDTFKPLIPKGTAPITLSSTASPSKNILKSSSTSKDTFGPSATTTTVQTTVQSSITNVEQIEKSTRYAQLPADAQSALLEAEQFINGQQLFSRDIKTRIDAFGGEDILHVNTQVSELLNDVNGLKEQLQAQSYMIARVGTDIKQQMDATAINKAIADYGHTRRIAASGDHHRYFAELYEKLRNQLGEFESAVGQIEQRLQQEMSAGRSPQDLGALISSQNQLFLTLSGKASELHQRVQSLLPPQHQQQQQQQQLQQKQDTAMTTWTATGL